MNLMRFKKVTSDEFVINTEIILDVSRLAESYVTGATCVMTFAGTSDSILTWTVDGTDAAEKLLNAQKMADYLIDKMLPYVGDKMNRKEFNTVYKLWDGMTIAEIHTETGIVRTSAANTALISLALS